MVKEYTKIRTYIDDYNYSSHFHDAELKLWAYTNHICLYTDFISAKPLGEEAKLTIVTAIAITHLHTQEDDNSRTRLHIGYGVLSYCRAWTHSAFVFKKYFVQHLWIVTDKVSEFFYKGKCFF